MYLTFINFHSSPMTILCPQTPCDVTENVIFCFPTSSDTTIVTALYSQSLGTWTVLLLWNTGCFLSPILLLSPVRAFLPHPTLWGTTHAAYLVFQQGSPPCTFTRRVSVTWRVIFFLLNFFIMTPDFACNQSILIQHNPFFEPFPFPVNILSTGSAKACLQIYIFSLP